MDLQLRDRKALVGGASRGLGAAIAESLAREGARVALAARPSGRLSALAAELGGVAVGVDLATADGPQQAIERAARALGGIDIVVVNGGGPPAGTFEELDEEKWRAAVQAALMYPISAVKTAVPYLRQGTDPAILFVLSSSVREAIPALDTSNVLRPGLAGLLKSLSGQLAPIRVNGIAPGRVSTDRIASLDAERAERRGVSVDVLRQETCARIPLGRYGVPSEVGTVACFLCSRAASYVTGAIVPVDGGLVRSLP